MRKFFAVLVLIGMLFGTIPCFAQGDTHSQVIYTEIITTTTSAADTIIPVTKIRPDVDKIVGVEVSCLNGSSNSTAVLYDSTSSTIAPTEVICEYEATSSMQSSGRFFPFPRYIVNGIVVSQPANTRVSIYYIRN